MMMSQGKLNLMSVVVGDRSLSHQVPNSSSCVAVCVTTPLDEVDAVMFVMYQPSLLFLSSGTTCGPDASTTETIAPSSWSVLIWNVDRSKVQLRTPDSAPASAVVSAFTSPAFGW